MSKSVLLRKREQIQRAREALLKQIGYGEEYDLFWRRTCGDMTRLNEGGVGASDDESEWWDLQ